MGALNILTPTGITSSTSQTDIGNQGDGISLKLKLRGDGLLDVDTSGNPHTLLLIGDIGTQSKLWVYAYGDATTLTIRMRWYYSGASYTQTTVGSFLRSAISDGTYYILFGAHDSTLDTDQEILGELFESDGTSVASSNVYANGALETGSGYGEVQLGSTETTGGHTDIQYDGLAIYSSRLTGAARYNGPASTDTDILAFWDCEDGSGATVTNRVSGGQNLTCGGSESTDFAWVAGGDWAESAPGGSALLLAMMM